MLYHLIYISSSQEPFTEDNFVKLLIQSRNNNLVNNITGILLYHKGSFIQYIEGSRPHIHQLIEKIKIDDRHYNVDIISEGEIEKRCFKDWNMEYKIFQDGELEAMVGCKSILKDADTAKRVIKLVKLFIHPTSILPS